MLSVPQTPPTRPLMLGVALVLALFLCGAWATARSTVDLHQMLQHELELRFLSGQLLSLQERLSKSARLAVETGDRQWEQRYRSTVPQFEAALRRAVAASPDDSTIGSPIWTASAALAGTEATAFDKLNQGQRAEARALLSSAEYEQRRAAYVEGLNKLSNAMMTQAQARLSLQRKLVLGSALLGLALLGALGAAWVWISNLVQQYLQAVQAADVLLAENNRQLDARVKARTAELQTVNQQLREEMEHRAKMETELRQAQKLEAVGRLAAGVAHEINTPVQFVSDNCHFLKQSTDDLLQLVARYEQALQSAQAGHSSIAEAANAIAEARQAADMDFLSAQMPQSASHALEGLSRVAQIVRSMKEYSHPGGQQRMKIDLNRAIASTLTIASNEIKYVADVHTEFGDVPEIYCFPGELNQVILNLLINAAHAIETVVKGTDRRGHITVSTQSQGPNVLITIQDDGCGIPEAIRDKIFEPFFTTKELGKGTGQGLALARSIIVDKHRGTLDVQSAQDTGTTFSIRIPIDPRAERVQAQAA